MSALQSAAADYLALRRAVGFKLERHDQLLASFIAFTEASGCLVVTTDVALAWASAPKAADAWWWTRRLSVVRGFARYLHRINPDHEVPPAGLITATVPRVTPYLFTETDLERLLDSTGVLQPSFRAATYRTLFGLLAVTGMRISETINLDDRDVDVVEGVVTVRHTKFDKTRELVLHPTTVEALTGYRELSRTRSRKQGVTSFFLTTVGTRPNYPNVLAVFHQLIDQLDMSQRRRGDRPRIHDVRHSFAVRTMLDGYEAGGIDLGLRFAALSTYLGHSKPADTYWYLSATPELLGQAAARLEASLGTTS